MYLFFCLTSSDCINAVRDSETAADVCWGHFMIKQLDPLCGSVNIQIFFCLLVMYVINRFFRELKMNVASAFGSILSLGDLCRQYLYSSYRQ